MAQQTNPDRANSITTPYITMDVNIHNDVKISAIMDEFGADGAWVISHIWRMMWIEDGAALSYDGLTFRAIKSQTRSQHDVKKIVDRAIEYGLFTKDGRVFYSEALLRRLERVDQNAKARSEKARNAANARWGNVTAKAIPEECPEHATSMQQACSDDAMRMLNDANQIKSDQTTSNHIHIVEQDEPARRDVSPIYEDVIDYLNAKADKNYKHTTKATQEKIRARMAEGFGLDDFKTVIDNKVRHWKGDPSNDRYLRPETLFGPKFESYLQENPNLKPTQKKRANDFTMSAESERELEEQIKEREMLSKMSFLEQNEYFRRKQEAANGR